ncbi:MAG: TonB-dependent receptor [Gammaproteobacteria bacterium]|nr:TonB-dependent receptor [Gammaproteobacteria bacterium]MYK84585.1 TonB-dependent receptor [Gammaproteobacteria bacterium]
MRDSGKPAPAFQLKPLAAAVALASAAPLAQAQVIEEVLVTATKRDESAQDVPLAITVLTGEFTRSANLNDVKDLVSFTPGVSGNSQDSFIDAISIRGVRTQDFGVGGDPSAAFFKNDLYEGRNGSAVTSLYDMERAEILRGPQGFLFGRNSIGGAFSVHTAKAETGGEASGYFDLDVGERNHLVLEGAVNVPVSDRFAMRIAAYSSQEDGFVKNHFGGDRLIEHDKQAIRWSTTFDGDRFTVQTMAELEERDQSGTAYRAIQEGGIWETFEAAVGDVDVRGDMDDADSDQSGGDADDAEILTLGLKLEYDLDFATLTSNTGYKDHDYYYAEDYDGTPININNYNQDQEGDYFQQEVRLTSNDDGPFSWYAGASYYKEEIDALFLFSGREDVFCQYYGYAYNYGMTFSGCADLYAYYGSPFSPSADGQLVETGRIIGDYSGWAAYVDLTYDLNERWDASFGARYSDDQKKFAINVPTPDSALGPYWAYTFSTDGPVNGTRSWTDTQIRVVTRYRINDDAMVFASYTEGFKSGGFGSFALLDAAGNGVGGAVTDVSQADGYRPNTFDPEVADSYEVGYKGSLAEGRANVSLTSFYYEYQDLQVVVFDGGASAVENVGQVESWGVEGTLQFVLGPHFDAYAGLSYLDSEATGLQGICGLENAEGCEGSSLFWAPKWTGAFVLNGYRPIGGAGGELNASLELFWESKRGGGWEGLESTEIDAFTNLTARVGYEAADNWGVDLYVENLTNEDTFDGLNNNGGVLPSHFFGPMRPRTFGVRFSYSWE